MLKTILAIVAAVTLSLTTLHAQMQAGRRVAITIDDGPVVNEMTDLGNFQRISNGLIGSFQVEKMPVTIFINERQLNVPDSATRAQRSSSSGSTPASRSAITHIPTRAPATSRSTSLRTT